MAHTTKIAIVVGGSLAGLMHGIILKKTGFKVRVLERSASDALNSEAAGIRAGPELHDFIQQHVPAAPEYAVTAQMVEIMDGDGNVVQQLPAPEPLRLTTWKIVYDLLKKALLGSLDGQDDATYETRQLVQDIEQAGEKMKVTIVDQDKGTTRAIESDLVIAADGAHSVIRKKLCPDAKPQYAGYVTWRGRIPEEAVSTQTRDVLRDRCVILRVEGGYQISYYVPRDGAAESDKRDFVWIWYDMVPDLHQLTQILTDVNGRVHQTTVPRGKMSPEIWQRVLARKSSVKNPHFLDLMSSIDEPFVSAISDFPAKKSLFYNDKLVLVGDAFALCRPHGGGSTSQAALQAQMLLRALRGEMEMREWERTCVAEADKAARFSLGMAEFFWNGGVTEAMRSAALAGRNEGQ